MSKSLGIKIPKNAFKIGKEKFDEGFKENVTLEPGVYLGVVEGGKAVSTGKGPQLVLDIVVGGECDQVGGKIGLWYSFEDERVVFLFRDLAKLGFDVDDLNEEKLVTILEEIKEARKVIKFKAVSNGDNTNYRIQKVIEDMTADEVLAGAGKADAESGADEEAGSKHAGKKKDVNTGKKAKEKEPEPEAEKEEEEEEEPEAESDGLDDLDREALKKLLKTEEITFVVYKSTTDDAIRAAIREARAAAAADTPEAAAAEAEQEEEAEVTLEVGMKVTVPHKGKKVKGKVKSLDFENNKAKIDIGGGVVITVAPDVIEPA